MVDEWRKAAAFMRHPSLEETERLDRPLTLLARIFALDMIVMLGLITAASIAVAFGVYLPKTALAGMEFTSIIILGVVVAAPVFEELLFRSWLSGRLAHIAALVAALVGLGGAILTHASAPIVAAILAIVGLIVAFCALVSLNKRPPMRWFVRAYPGIFWFAALSFALVHLFNFDALSDWRSLAILLPLVLPQFVLGALLGYVRVQVGLWAAMLLHAAHNSVAVSLAALSALAQ
ncbi:type II CAAX prenyl endopeptidase Rce1 family protein [Qipengyuania sp. ASV99]